MACRTRGVLDICGDGYFDPLAERSIERLAFRGAILADVVDHEGIHRVAV
jgi:hypothetical protein